MGIQKAGEGRRQATDFREAKCCSSAVVQGAAQQKMVQGDWCNWNWK